ncbi:MAG: DUF3536 domain-containing protein [Elusimicrobia bacterium]|nr:DUF3536 domain-containing protein [Elusimicrobiota bacterium]
MSARFVCIHGHFYQPPRENPWTGTVEKEESASPFHDWNERILNECYGPNAASPILDDQDRIRALADNYEEISFNFGPTLLSWIEERHPSLHLHIVQADARSARRRHGHGNAIAQVYNHMILPLASRRDKLTQVRWGACDFRRRFHRDPEGMWLAETAVDEETLEVLIAEGIRFTVLSPAQAAAVRSMRASGKEDWSPVSEATLDASRPYRWFSREAPGRFLDIFFFQGELSRAVSFERLLSSGDEFARRVESALRPGIGPQLVPIATDGEVYGHHHPFGNMSLSYALQRLRQNGIRTTNFGEFLEKFPPGDEVEIRPGTSWSCAHGIERWRADCGCSTGAHPDWNQKWRAPLREALEWLAGELDRFFADSMGSLVRDPWRTRDAYAEYFTDPSPQQADRFLDQAAIRHPTPEEGRQILRLCDMQRQRLFMFTSCGWFFDDISGIEPAQNLKYAARALDLAREGGHPGVAALEEEFLKRLAGCASNRPDSGNGADVYRRRAAPLRVDASRAVAHFAEELHIYGNSLPTPAWRGRATLLERNAGSRPDEPDRILSVAHCEIRRSLLAQRQEGTAIVFQHGRLGFECWVALGSTLAGSRETAQKLSAAFTRLSEQEFHELLQRTMPGGSHTLDALFPDARRSALEFLLPHGTREKQRWLRDWRPQIRRFQDAGDEGLGWIIDCLQQAARAGIVIDALSEAETLRAWIVLAFRGAATRLSLESLETARRLLESARGANLHLNPWEILQLYALLRGRLSEHSEADAARRPFSTRAAPGDMAEPGAAPELRKNLEALDRLLNFAPLSDATAPVSPPMGLRRQTTRPG